MQPTIVKTPYITEAARFYDYLSYSRLVQTSDHRFVFEIPIRKDFVPGACWRRRYSDGTWSLSIEMGDKFYPRTVHMTDWLNKAEQSTVFATEDDFQKFHAQMEGTEPITLSDLTNLEDRIYHSEHGVKPYPPSSGSINHDMRQWHDLASPPPIPSWERDRIRIPVPQYHVRTSQWELPPQEHQIQSQSAEYREAGTSSMPDLTMDPTSFNHYLEQKEFIRRRELIKSQQLPPASAPLPSLLEPIPHLASTSTNITTQATTSTVSVKKRLGPRIPSNKPARMGSGPADPPLLHSRPYHVNHQLTEVQVRELNDGQLKRQLTALKRKYQRTLAEKRPNLGHLISQQISWYQAEQYRRRVGPFRPKQSSANTSLTESNIDSEHGITTVASSADITSSNSGMQLSVSTSTVDVEMPMTAVSDTVITESVSLTPPHLPKRRRLITPPSLPPKKETSAEKLYRMFLVEPGEDTMNESYWSGEKIYLGGGLSDWSEIDSPDTQKRYERRHVKRRDKNPIITRKEYRDKKLLALSRGYDGLISNSPYKKEKFCRDGKPEPPRWWKKEKKDRIKESKQNCQNSSALK